MKPNRIIGLTGLAGAGKDTVRDMLEAEHDFFGMAFADPIRDMVGALLAENGFSTKWMFERPLKEQPIDGLDLSYRHLAQTLGTEWGRQLHPDFWLRIAQAHMESLRKGGARQFVISDVRFLNEAEWVKAQGGEVWRIERPNIAAVRDHESERQVSLIWPDKVIDNSGTVEDLWCQVSALASHDAGVVLDTAAARPLIKMGTLADLAGKPEQ